MVLGGAGASDDQTSRPMYRKAAQERMRKLRRLTGLEEVARRIVDGWEDAYEGARQEMRADVVLWHSAKEIGLPCPKAAGS